MKENGEVRMIYNNNGIFRMGVMYAAAILLMTSCNRPADVSVNREEKTSDSEISSTEQTEITNDEEIQKIYDLYQNFNFAIQEYPINTEVYNADMDRKYKEAFLEFLFHTKNVTYDDEEDPFFYDFTWELGTGAGKFTNEDYIEAMTNKARYWYLDFDGDGMPELVVELSGVQYSPIVLRYDLDKQNVYIFAEGNGNGHWNFLCARNFYYDDPSSVGLVQYALARYDLSGNKVITLEFNIQYQEDCTWEFTVSYRNEEDVNNIIEAYAVVSEEMWNELTEDFFYAVDNVPPSMTFNEVFGEMASSYIH